MTYIGVDLNLIQPELLVMCTQLRMFLELIMPHPYSIPPNTKFVQQDIEMPWQDLEPGSWDLIHMRTLHGSIANWPKLYQEVHRQVFCLL